MTSSYDSNLSGAGSSLANTIVAVIIFIIVSFTFLFPLNRIITLDRRSVSVLGATLCYAARLFTNNGMDILNSIDFDVLVLLASIMAINHIVVHLKETKYFIQLLQFQIQSNPLRGFWLVSCLSFIVAPFLTNDGVCLLFVEIILNAFQNIPDNNKGNESASFAIEPSSSYPNVGITSEETNDHVDKANNNKSANPQLERSDALYFLLALSCSANIGSALTYTGNPQNMIVAQDALSVLSPMQFLGYMIVPTLIAWLMTTFWIQYCWTCAKSKAASSKQTMDSAHRESFHSLTQDDLTQPRDTAAGHYLELPPLQPTSYVPTASDNELIAVKAAYENSQKSPDSDEKTHDLRVSTDRKSLSLQVNVDEEQGIHKEYLAENGSPTASTWSVKNHSSKSKRTKYDSARFSDVSLSLFPWANTNSPLRLCDGSGESEATDNQSLLPLSPRKQRMQEREAAYQRFYFVISSPVPYLIFVILLAMIVMIFVDVISISGLVCVTAVLMTITLVWGNLWRGREVWGEGQVSSSDKQRIIINNKHRHQELTYEDRLDSINEFFDSLFDSIDYSLLLIFLGLFVVVANLESTGIPKQLWDKIVGQKPFDTVASVAAISAFVLLSSQFLGNVPVIQLAKPNIAGLGDQQKHLAWLVVSFVATIGGNLTITGSAANIIVAEKANKIDPTSNLDFFKHYKVCFWVTLLSCAVGGVIIVLMCGAM